MANSESWEKIFQDYKILSHNFKKNPFCLTADKIKKSVQEFTHTNQKEVRILCKHDTREDRPKVMQDNNLFLLPIKNGVYAIIKGEGYVDIPDIDNKSITYVSQLQFHLDSVTVGNSEMQHLDYAYACSIIRTFMDDPKLVLTIRGRKYTPKFSFMVYNHKIQVNSVQTEVDAGYESNDKIVLIEAKNTKTSNVIIRQLFYPFKQWSMHTNKKIYSLFFEKRDNEYYIWQYEFKDKNNYNSIHLVTKKRYCINE